MVQNYVTEAENEYVIRGNTAVIKCKIPSFVSDFVSVDAWLDDENFTYTAFDTNANSKGSHTYCTILLTVVCRDIFYPCRSLTAISEAYLYVRRCVNEIQVHDI